MSLAVVVRAAMGKVEEEARGAEGGAEGMGGH